MYATMVLLGPISTCLLCRHTLPATFKGHPMYSRQVALRQFWKLAMMNRPEAIPTRYRGQF